MRRSDCDSGEIDRSTRKHALEVVYTVVTDTALGLAAIIAVHHLLESDADVLVVPHLTDDEVRRNRAWHLVIAFAELVTGAGVVDRTLLDSEDTAEGDRSAGH
ncbi:hypothetical protein [Nocardia sp. NPDC003963]